MTREEMLRMYEQWSAAHKYIVGFIKDGKLYYTIMVGMIRDDVLKAEKAAESKGGMNKIRVRLNVKLRAILVATGKAALIGKASDLLDSKYNKGEMFEKVITEKLAGKVWEKDSVPFWQAGDIELNGEQVQIKLDGAELTNEKTLARHAKELAMA